MGMIPAMDWPDLVSRRPDSFRARSRSSSTLGFTASSSIVFMQLNVVPDCSIGKLKFQQVQSSMPDYSQASVRIRSAVPRSALRRPPSAVPSSAPFGAWRLALARGTMQSPAGTMKFPVMFWPCRAQSVGRKEHGVRRLAAVHPKESRAKRGERRLPSFDFRG
jgi:hypothetical protein